MKSIVLIFVGTNKFLHLYHSCLDLGDKDRLRKSTFDEYFVYLQNYIHLADPKALAETKYLLMVLKRYESKILRQT